MDKTELLGIGCGLGAAFFQSLSYVCSRLFIKRHQNNILALLALSHAAMGIVSIPLAAMFWPASMPPLSQYAGALAGAAGFYLLGQFFLFAAIIHCEPSRISPLLGLKVFMLTLIGVLFLDQRFGPAQWLAVLCSTLAVFLLSYSGRRLEFKFVALGILTGVSYCLSDINIKALVDHFRFLPTILHAAAMATALCYILCGLVGAAMLLLRPADATRQTWLYALPFAASWFIAMIFLFSAFGTIGVVFGNILQSTRGIVSMGMGFMIAHLGFETLEPKASGRVIAQRAVAAVLMTAAVALFLI
ncbi:MAG: DMT family transporter [Planctomycetales bacterium]|nr:DMT family transporter [Planctomycetales bacterium]